MVSFAEAVPLIMAGVVGGWFISHLIYTYWKDRQRAETRELREEIRRWEWRAERYQRERDRLTEELNYAKRGSN